MMPFESKAQQRFAYAHPEKFGGEKGLKEWSSATDFSKLPEKKRTRKFSHAHRSSNLEKNSRSPGRERTRKRYRH